MFDKELGSSNVSFESLAIRVISAKNYVDMDRMSPITYIYYLMSLDGVFKYSGQLPMLDLDSVS